MNDWNPVIVALAAAIPGLAAAVIALMNRTKIREIHLTVNSRLDQLVTLNKQLSMSEGIALGRRLRPDAPTDPVQAAQDALATKEPPLPDR